MSSSYKRVGDEVLFCPECHWYYEHHNEDSPTCIFKWETWHENGLVCSGWVPKDQSTRGVASRGNQDIFGLYRQ